MIKVVMDCFGGDHSPNANVEGALRALEEMNDLEIILTGDEKALSTKLVGQKYDAKRLSIVHAPEVISCNEAPTLSVFHKKESSLVKALDLLRLDPTVNGLISIDSSQINLFSKTVSYYTSKSS